MNRSARLIFVFLLLPLACDRASAAGSVRPGDLYELAGDSQPHALKVGGRGELVIRIKPRDKAHVTAPPEAPLRITYRASNVKLDAPDFRYVHPDDQGKAVGADSTPVADPTFRVPFVAVAQGSDSVNAEVTFLICLEKTLCSRQKRTISIPVEVL
ncbi:MAG TPA: hypothetical protein VEY30_07755 [Myxococcaceae bacterium]|nr:hypothetical protein [Myxococcaceae bacterium]